ncbi:MAG: GTP cyclohydrolase I [Actinomycetes bacterium]
MVDQKRVAAAVVELLAAIGEDPSREGLVETPHKVAESWAELFKGVGVDPASSLDETYPAENSGIVVMTGIDAISMCEHHLLPFTATVDIAYLPGERIVGLGRLPKLVDLIASRPQIQERLTSQIADALAVGLSAKAVLVRVQAKHDCVAVRSLRQQEAKTVTLEARGLFLDASARQEALSLISK